MPYFDLKNRPTIEAYRFPDRTEKHDQKFDGLIFFLTSCVFDLHNNLAAFLSIYAGKWIVRYNDNTPESSDDEYFIYTDIEFNAKFKLLVNTDWH